MCVLCASVTYANVRVNVSMRMCGVLLTKAATKIAFFLCRVQHNLYELIASSALESLLAVNNLGLLRATIVPVRDGRYQYVHVGRKAG